MATGRRDYTWGFVSESSAGSRCVESFCKTVHLIYQSGEYKEIYSYTVPKGKRLLLNNIILSTEGGITTYAYVYIDSDAISSIRFSENVIIPYPDASPVYVHAEQKLKVMMGNPDSVSVGMMCNVIAALETL